MADDFPTGFRGAGVHCGVKSDPTKPDLTLLVSDRPAAAVGVYTQNLVKSAPVLVNQARTPSESARAVVINSGIANACTGERGHEDALRMARLAAEQVGCAEDQALVMSTGVIGEHLPMENIARGITDAGSSLDAGAGALESAARGMMTTDTVPKTCCRRVQLDGSPVAVTGMAKGAAMIGPNLATMLAVVMTDARLAAADAQAALSDAVVDSFNCISVDGHMSTSDTVLLLANGAATSDRPPLSGRGLADFRSTLDEVCEELAIAIPADGEGASHLITVEVHGCASRDDARRIGKTVADSPLVKTAVAGADPNWGEDRLGRGLRGRRVRPVGRDAPDQWPLGVREGVPVPFDEAAVSESIRSQRDTLLVLLLEEGDSSARFWTTDLTAEYVRLNADYRT